jgi:copper(I)-binding protein
MNYAALLIGVLGFTAANAVAPHDCAAHGLTIDHPYARATPPGARVGGAYMIVQNAGAKSDRLVRVTSPVAGAVELHTATVEGNLMKMRETSSLEVPAGGRLTLQPGGYHMMLVDLKRPLAVGDKVPMTLTFEKAGTIDVVVRVEAMGAQGEPPHRH